MVSLYFHIPFCKKKCPYCHFYVVSDKNTFKEQLLHALKLEWRHVAPLIQGKKLVSIYFGGGTPTLFGPQRLEEVLSWIDLYSDAEITIETNPEERVDYAALRSLGINRLSFGLQSLQKSELAILGRNHSPEQSFEAIYSAKKAGFDNITIDLMYDLPGQTIDSWQKTLEEAATLPITHLSLYNLTIEPHTPFQRKEEALRKEMPDEETSAAMYTMAQEILAANGFSQYEISAFCKDNLYSRHNIGYWTGRHFYGLGPSAFSFDGQRRFRNVPNLARYSKLLEEGQSPVDFEESETPSRRKKELLALHLRLIEGVELNQFQPLEKETEDALQKLSSLGLLEIQKGHAKLTRRGLLFYDTIASELI